jgi:thiamine biosynthesis protein ThiI
MKRGVAVLPWFMDQRPIVGDSYVERAIQVFIKLASYIPRKSYHLYSAPIGEIMQRIMETSEPKFTCVICKRSMYRIAQSFALEHGAKAIVTGESLGQVASQTLDNMYVLSSAVSLPILRPLVGLDKVEIEDQAKAIGSYEISTMKTNGCTAVPTGPATRSKINVIEKLESELDLLAMCNEAADNISVIAEG